ncbi:hypothetical protein ZWY2020_060129 [Hordeum vulgare]|nr:hypothetical protein ZWY2020_060129 [Hordeum vulgare]
MRGQEAPRRYKPYYEHDQRGHQPHGYRGHGHRGYDTPKFSAQRSYPSPSKPFDGQRAREEDSYGRRQISAQEAPTGGYRRYQEPTRAQFPAALPYHPYARDAGEVDRNNKQEWREHRPYQHRRNGKQRRGRKHKQEESTMKTRTPTSSQSPSWHH